MMTGPCSWPAVGWHVARALVRSWRGRCCSPALPCRDLVYPRRPLLRPQGLAALDHRVPRVSARDGPWAWAWGAWRCRGASHGGAFRSPLSSGPAGCRRTGWGAHALPLTLRRCRAVAPPSHASPAVPLPGARTWPTSTPSRTRWGACDAGVAGVSCCVVACCPSERWAPCRPGAAQQERCVCAALSPLDDHHGPWGPCVHCAVNGRWAGGVCAAT